MNQADQQQVVILSTQRSGTHFLLSLVSSHPFVFGMGEVFHSRSRFSFPSHIRESRGCDVKKVFANDGISFVEALNHFIEIQNGKNQNVVVFILMYNQLDRLPEACRREIFKGRRVLHLIRQNILRTHVSDYINNNSNKPAHSRKQDAKAVKVHLPVDGLLERLSDRQARIQLEQERLRYIDHLEVLYEDIVASRENLGGIFTYLNMPDAELRTTLRRSNPQRLSELLSNYQDVERIIGDSEFAHLLEDE